MGNLIMLVLCLGIGMVLRASRRVPDNAHLAINGFIINVSLPALTLIQIHQVELKPSMALAVAMPWLVFAVASAAMLIIARAMKLSANTTGALILTAGLANTSFVGLPMIETFYGARFEAVGIMIDQLGTYLVLSTAGIAIACWMSRGTASVAEIARRVVTFPPLIALCLALLLMPVTYPQWLTEVLTRISGTLAPLALVSVGLQLRLGALRERFSTLAVGLSFKLLVAPLIFAVLCIEVLGMRGTVSRVTIFEAAMGPQIGAAIVAMQYGLDPPLVTLMVGIGSVAAFVTLPMWWYALQFA